VTIAFACATPCTSTVAASRKVDPPGRSTEALADTLKGHTLKGHPHFMMGDTASIEITELMPMPGSG